MGAIQYAPSWTRGKTAPGRGTVRCWCGSLDFARDDGGRSAVGRPVARREPEQPERAASVACRRPARMLVAVCPDVSPWTGWLMHTPEGRRDFLKQLTAVTTGLWVNPELARADE